MNVYLVGSYYLPPLKEGDNGYPGPWSVWGVFEDQALAEACAGKNGFVMPLILNQSYSEDMPLIGAYYPGDGSAVMPGGL